ncbi:MAG: alpha/beta hydrolase [Microbacteriaceae bacterium]|jgi:acetyl esterase|nr:alpha/beta hydrolase [Microbacteriaceae bacterium]HEV7956868.1 alpha/beta hydrolase [Marisediminicola sp.]
MTAARPLALAAIVLLAGGAATGFAWIGLANTAGREPGPQPAYPVLQTYPGVVVIENLDYGSAAGGILLDVCLPDSDPASAATTLSPQNLPRAAVVSVHGGSWRQGDKSDLSWRNVCEWLASEGFVAASINYRLAPSAPFPAAIEDLRKAVRWLREDEQIERFDIDPERIGALGGSAGGNLVAQLGLEGEGALTVGSRVAAVVELSGPIDLTVSGFTLGGVDSTFRQIQLDYLGCTSYTDCPQALDASPLYDVDKTDPPMFVGHSVDEFIPIEQSDALVAALRNSGVDTTYVTVEGALHSIAMLDEDTRLRIGGWLRVKLAA